MGYAIKRDLVDLIVIMFAFGNDCEIQVVNELNDTDISTNVQLMFLNILFGSIENCLNRTKMLD